MLNEPVQEQPAVNVRDATIDDVPALRACLDIERHAERIASADGFHSRYVVVEAGGQVVGFGRLTLRLSEVREKWGAAVAPRITNLNVREDMRGRGFGSALIVGMERMTVEAGFDRLHIGAHPQNKRTLGIYLRLGYEVMEQQPRQRRRRRWFRRRRPPAVYLMKRLA